MPAATNTFELRTRELVGQMTLDKKFSQMMNNAQVYLSANRSGYPLRQLAAFQRIHLAAKASQILTFTLTSAQFTRVLEDGTRVLEPGAFTLFVGGGQPGWSEGAQTTVEIR